MQAIDNMEGEKMGELKAALVELDDAAAAVRAQGIDPQRLAFVAKWHADSERPDWPYRDTTNGRFIRAFNRYGRLLDESKSKR